MAVAAELQRRGVGAALIRAGLDACRAAGHTIVFVLGHPAYYPRFGFEPASEHGFAYEGGPAFARAFFVRALAPGAFGGRSGVVSYHREFAEL
jgi:putative acetyltransferase